MAATEISQPPEKTPSAASVEKPVAESAVEAPQAEPAAVQAEEKPKKVYTEAQKQARIANAAKAREAYLRKIELKRRLDETSRKIEDEKTKEKEPAAESVSAPVEEPVKEKEEAVPETAKDAVKDEPKEEKEVANTKEEAVAAETESAPASVYAAPVKRKRFEDLMMPNARARTISFDVVKKLIPPPKKPRFSMDDLF